MAHKTFSAACLVAALVVGCVGKSTQTTFPEPYDEDLPAATSARDAASNKPTPAASANSKMTTPAPAASANGKTTVSTRTPENADDLASAVPTQTPTIFQGASAVPEPGPTPDTRWAVPGIRTTITPQATQGMWELEASIVSGILHPDMRVIAERRATRFGEWQGVTEVHPQHLVERGGEVFLLAMLTIPGYSLDSNRDGGVIFRWNTEAKRWVFQKEFTGLLIHHPWFRSEQLAGIFQNILIPLVGGTGWKYSLADGSVAGKVTLNAPDGTRVADISFLEEWLPLCSAPYQCGTGQGAKLPKENMENIFNGKFMETPYGFVLVTVLEKVGETVTMTDGTGYQPRWQEFAVWIQRTGQARWEKKTNFSRFRSQDTLFMERIPGGVNAPFGETNFIALFGDGETLLLEEQWLFR